MLIKFSEFPRSRPGFEPWLEESSLWYVLYFKEHSSLKFSDKCRPVLGSSEIPIGSCYLFELASQKGSETWRFSVMIRGAV